MYGKDEEQINAYLETTNRKQTEKTTTDVFVSKKKSQDFFLV